MGKSCTCIYNVVEYFSYQSIKIKSPYEACCKTKPTVSHIKVFRCISYAQIPQAKKSKLDAKSQLAIHLGNNDKSKGYKLCNLEIEKSVYYQRCEIWRRSKVELGQQRNWEFKNENIVGDVELGNENQVENDDGFAIRGTRTLQDIHERCNVVIHEPVTFTKAQESKEWQ